MIRKIVLGAMLLVGMAVGAVAQNLVIKGSVREADRQTKVEFANVVLQTMDSTFVAGATTDAQGNFSLGKLSKGNYRLVVSCIGYQPATIDLKGFERTTALGEILLSEEATALEGVTVSGSAQTTRSDRKLVFPSERQVKASRNGVDLLQQLMLPRLQVDPLNNTIKLAGNGTVQLRINGVKVEQQEIQALQPADIIRIEYHDDPSLRYGDVDAVLDYIVHRPETGGGFGLDSQQSVNRMWGTHNVQAKVNHKRSEWNASYRFGPRDFYGSYRDNREHFELADGRTIDRIEEGVPSHLELYMHNAHLTYNYQEAEKQFFNATLRYWGNRMPHDDYRGILRNSADPTDYVYMTDLTPETYHSPALDLYYQRTLPNEQLLVFNVVGTYIGSDSRRTYQEQRGDLLLTDIHNRVEGRKYSLIGEAIYEKAFTNGLRLSAGLNHTHSFSDNTYRNGHTYQTHLTQMSSSAYGELKGRLNKLDYTVGLSLLRTAYDQRDGLSETKYNLNSRLTLFYHLPGEQTLRFQGRIRSNAPSLSQLSAVEQAIDSIQIQRGNPDLHYYIDYRTQLNYTLQKGLFYVDLLGIYQYQPKAIMDEKYQEGNRIVQTWDNQKSAQGIFSTATLRVGPIRDLLQFSFTGGVRHFISRGNTYTHRYTNWWYSGDLSLTWKRFSFMYSISSNVNSFWGETMSGGENFQYAQLSYRVKQVTLGLFTINPFMNNWKQETENWNRFASYHRTSHIKESSNVIGLSLSYNFSFGRSFKSAQKRVNNSDSDSGVRNAGK
ncbi:MAG: carboxypeptidase-like regulatory domain-containing protein [Parabacteroides sp.]